MPATLRESPFAMPRLIHRVLQALSLGLAVALMAAAFSPWADQAPHPRMVRTIPVAYHPQVQNSNKAKTAPIKPTGPQPSLAEELGPKPARNEAPKLFQTPSQTASQIVAKLVGNKACAECHPGEHALHYGSGHARTLKPAGKNPVAAKLQNKTFRDDEQRHILWRYVVHGDRLDAEQFKDGKWTCQPLDYAIGSGEHGMTFMSIIWDPVISQYKGQEHRLSYYTSSDHMDITPGQGERDSNSKSYGISDTGRLMDKKSLVKCLDCHATITSGKDVGDFDPVSIVPNVSCERCHGPGRDHVEAARKGEMLAMPLGHDTATPFVQIQECGKCHRRIDLVPPSQLHPDNHELARFQPVGIQASACFNDGKSGLKCTTCHDPHGKVTRDRTTYVNACVNCHQSETQTKCKVEPKGDCINCHMPNRTVSEVFQFTDHWIRKPTKK